MAQFDEIYVTAFANVNGTSDNGKARLFIVPGTLEVRAIIGTTQYTLEVNESGNVALVAA